MDSKSNYLLEGISVYNIRNRNELRVIKMLPEILNEYGDFEPDPLDIQDIYALALNSLPARYTQQGGMVLKDSVEDISIIDAIHEAIEIVISRPNH